MTETINQEHEEVLNFAYSLPSGLTKEQIYVRIHERAKSAAPIAAAVPAGWKLVPIEPTEAMRQAAASFGGSGNGYSAQRGDEAATSYRHMLAAAPLAPSAAAVTESQPADERKLFEKFATRAMYVLEWDDEGHYERGDTDSAWDGWKARAALSAPAAPVPAAAEGTPRRRFEAWAKQSPTPYDLREHKFISNGARTFMQDRTQWAFEAYCGALALSFLPAAPATSDKAEG